MVSNEQDFYPTPERLIEKMLSGVDFTQVNNILEPSAGKGDICDWIREHKEERYNVRKLPMDVIEIEPNLQLVLKGKNYNLIHDDFLTFRSSKQYSLIVANFPFSDGDKHLKKAIEVLEMYGGTLVCLVNAETIKNPHTNLRRTLVALLEKHGASIEYLRDEFVDAERTTSVEVALIRMVVTYEPGSSTLLDNLKKAESIEVEEDIYSGIVEADFIKSLVRHFEIECKLGVNLIKEYDALKPLIMKRLAKKDSEADKYNEPVIKLTIGNANDYNKDYVNEYLREIRHKYWSLLIGDSRFNGHYTSNVIKDLSQKLTDLRECDFSEFNITQLQDDLNKSLISGIEKAILDMFDEFSVKYAYHAEFGKNIHYYNGWKSNKAHKINKKIILPVNGFSSYSFSNDKLDNYYIRERLADMVKVFNYLAGEMDGIGRFVDNQIEHANSMLVFRNIGFHYFDATFYKKGTCHITFKDQKLLDKFNIFGARKRGWLPPSYGKKAYADMDAEEREVIDGFQGEEEYNKVVTDSDYYLVESSQLLLGE